MQTFLPLPSVAHTACVLDNKRLNSQIHECVTIYRAATGMIDGYRNHPATVMWQGHTQALLHYAKYMVAEAHSRFIATAVSEEFLMTHAQVGARPTFPSWTANRWVHMAHRSNLIRKDPDHYELEFIMESTPLRMPYLWPRWNDDTHRWDLTISASEMKRAGQWTLPPGLTCDMRTRIVTERLRAS